MSEFGSGPGEDDPMANSYSGVEKGNQGGVEWPWSGNENDTANKETDEVNASEMAKDVLKARVDINKEGNGYVRYAREKAGQVLDMYNSLGSDAKALVDTQIDTLSNSGSVKQNQS